ncbi:flagellar protein FlaG [Nitrococcus mobilis]|uniref:Flagellin FlaG, putative n=1 Tax=Nitrococcus mobilis Nb-231 TaxID=314278 RepID=A4BUC9_9GAMM|nr:flagellar protein FlaG [Nitrococcus mobilis]EAR20643.1 flagellin FlaG, putative [Nitrococcus mobilis Nb-231]
MSNSINDSLVAIPPVMRHAEVNQGEAARGRPSRAERINPTEVANKTDGARAIVPAESIAEAAQKVRDFLQVAQRNLEFSVDKESGVTIIRVLNAATGELVRQIPPDEVLDIAERLDQPEGVLLRGQA